MKHILNDLTEQEKNAIREQHTGGMKVITENFSKLINSKLGDVKLIKEQNAKSDYLKEHTKESWLKNAKNLFMQKGYKVISNSPFVMKKGKNEIRHGNFLGNDVFSLTIDNYPAFVNTHINLDNYHPMGPFKVKYYKRGNVGETQVTETQMNGSEVWKLLQDFQ